ncbi:hypothetical protein GOODEAATRI_013185 [Goodea atripinnis]|uniref:Uncharacterized protein n=1 Tax=Goodea atripinnis TaxID=208336 RepID=A0ABV0MHE7_9TELE
MGSRAPQLRAPSFPVPDSACSLHVPASEFSDPQQHQHQFGNVMLPSNGYSFSPRRAVDYNSPLPTSSPLPWSHAFSSDVDFYGQETVSLGGFVRERHLLIFSKSNVRICKRVSF